MAGAQFNLQTVYAHLYFFTKQNLFAILPLMCFALDPKVMLQNFKMGQFIFFAFMYFLTKIGSSQFFETVLEDIQQ